MENIKGEIIEAIQNQNLIKIYFHKENSCQRDERSIAPYDIYSRVDKSGRERDYLLGYSEENFNIPDRPFSQYLDNIESVTILDKKFNGHELRGLLKPKNLPNIPRNWCY